MQRTAHLLIAALVVVTATCGGDDEANDVDAAASSSTPPPTTVNDDAAANPDGGDLEAWCLGWDAGREFTDEEVASGALEANAADTAAAVPADLRETWAIYEAGAEDDADFPAWSKALNDIERYWVENCDIQVGTPITQP